MDPETKLLDTEEEYRVACRTLLWIGFQERSSARAPGHMSCVMVAPDGYTLRLVYRAKGIHVS